ncbi:MAG: ABC transporter permease [Polyangiaceae bacterium]|nr:ABC transporter permease [Myxococcales bacterium]MCB9587182.1 ABC transporter permease [Polyangiaceae bacterium]
MKLAWFLALRFMWDQRLQSLLIVSGVGIGVAVMVFITALITGLQTSLIDRTLGTQPHVIVSPLEREGRPLREAADGQLLLRHVERPMQQDRAIDEWQKAERVIQMLPEVEASVPLSTGPGTALRGNTEQGVLIIGADSSRFDAVIPIRKNLKAGRYEVSGSDVVLGVELAKNLGVGIGDRVRFRTASSEGQVYSIRGIVDMGGREMNRTWVLMSFRAAQTLTNQPGRASAIYVRVKDIYGADATARTIAGLTGLTTRSWIENNTQLMTALSSQSASTTMIRFFVLVSVAIGIASVLVVSVIQRSKEVGILRAMGAARGIVLRVFLVQGGVIGAAGSLVGSVLGFGLTQAFGALVTNPDGSAFFPFAVTPQLFALAFVVSTAAGVVAGVVPARRAAALDPAEAIRNG